MVKKIMLTITMVALLGIVALNGIQTNDIFAAKDPQNGWDKITSEEAGESGRDFGAHASGQDDDPNDSGDAPFDDDKKPGRGGLGNLGLHPNDLGNLLDDIDCGNTDDPGFPDCN